MSVRSDQDIRAEAHAWRTRIDEGLPPDEKLIFEQWRDAEPRHAEAYAEARLFWDATDSPKYAEALRETLERKQVALAGDIPEDGAATAYTSGKIHIFGGLITALGALAALLVFLPSIDPITDAAPPAQIFASERGETKVLTLSDRTKITLGPDSIIEVALSDSARRTRLRTGSALFDVTSNGSPFLVVTDIGEVEVTGTTFEVRQKGEDIAVAVGEGSVLVKASGEDLDPQSSMPAIELVGGQGVTLSPSGRFGDVTQIFPAELAAWRSGRLAYIEAPLSEVVADLNRYSAQPIRLDPEVSSLEISGTFDASDLDTLLAYIDEGLPVRVRQTKSARIIEAD